MHTISFPEELWDKMEERKQRLGIPISQQLRLAIEKVISDEQGSC